MAQLHTHTAFLQIDQTTYSFCKMLTFLSRAALRVHIMGATYAILNFLIATLKKKKESSETNFSSIFNIFKILIFQEAIYIKQIINEFLTFVLNVHSLVCILHSWHISVCTRHMFLVVTKLDSAALDFSSVQFSSVAQSCPTLCDPMGCNIPGFPVHHQHPELAQTHVHWVGDAIQPSCPLSSPSPPASNLPQHQGLSQWVSSSHQVAKVLVFKHQSFQQIFRTDVL